MIVTSQAQRDVVTVVSEGAVQSMPPPPRATAPEAGWIEGDTTGWSLGVIGVVQRTSGGSPSTLMLGGSRSPAQGESLVQWMDPQDLTLTIFSLHDASKSIEQESLDEGISVMMDVLN